jgi:DNA-3-methyladenine glycosylase
VLKLTKEFYAQSALVVAQDLIGKLLVRKFDNGEVARYRITETECYIGEEDTACHARLGKTERNKIMYEVGGHAYIYLCYGIHHLLNVTTGGKNQPEAVLIRGIEGFDGPGKLTKALGIRRELNEVDLCGTGGLWIEDDGMVRKYRATSRIGIDYAAEPYRSIEWRFVIEE